MVGNVSAARGLLLSPAYSGAWEWEYWDVGGGHRLMQGYWWMSLLISALYIPLSLLVISTILNTSDLGQSVVKRPWSVRYPLLVWNTALCVFSILGAARMLPDLVYVIRTHGLRYSVCDNSFSFQAVTGFWTEMFGWSKLLELVDTLFLVLKKRPLTPLHLWHHASVFVFTWHACRDLVAAGRWFVTMNYTVHGLMYAYFALQSMGGIKLPKPVSVSITVLQILQMFIGVAITGWVWLVKANGGECATTWANLRFCGLVYASYSLLFLHFFYNAYIARPKTKAQ